MINITLLWLLLVPLGLSIICIFAIPKITQGAYTYGQAAIMTFVGFLVAVLICAVAVYAGRGAKTADTEIWNGEVTGKTRTHDEYKKPYDCNCRTVQNCTGSGKDRRCTPDRKCDTCWEDRYTATWRCQSNIGSWTIQHLDRSTRRVWDEPDPARYTVIQKGDPVSKTNSYTNYIKGVPESLFRPASETLKAQFAGQIPTYPINIYDFYKVDRVLPVGVNMPNVSEWNFRLSEALKKLGPAKQANAVIVVTKSPDPNYFYALQDAWVNGKKNDIVLVIGAPDFPKKAAWVNVMALTQENIFQVRLRDEILGMEELTAEGVVGSLNKIATESFKRKRMRDFKYLEDEIDPPDWVLITAVLLIVAAYVGGLLVLRSQVSSSPRSGYNRFRR